MCSIVSIPVRTPGTRPACAGVGVVLVGYGASPLEPSTLEAILDLEIVEVRNPRFIASDHQVAEHAGHVVVSTANDGYGTAANTGVAALPDDLDLVLVCTADAALALDCVDVLATTLRDHPHVAVVGPVLTTVEASAAGGADSITSTMAGGTYSRWGGLHHRFEPMQLQALQPVDWIDGAVMMVRRSAFEAVGGFASDRFLYCEDADLCFRVRAAGWSVVVAGAAHARQRSGMSRRAGAHAYLLVRNSVWLAGRSSGSPSSGVAVARGVAQSLAEVAKVVGWRRTLPRIAHLRQAVGSLAGVVDAIRGRSGPPPRWLASSTDIGAAC